MRPLGALMELSDAGARRGGSWRAALSPLSPKARYMERPRRADGHTRQGQQTACSAPETTQGQAGLTPEGSLGLCLVRSKVLVQNPKTENFLWRKGGRAETCHSPPPFWGDILLTPPALCTSGSSQGTRKPPASSGGLASPWPGGHYVVSIHRPWLC